MEEYAFFVSFVAQISFSCARKENRECLILFIVSYQQYLFSCAFKSMAKIKNVVVRCFYDHEKLFQRRKEENDKQTCHTTSYIFIS